MKLYFILCFISLSPFVLNAQHLSKDDKTLYDNPMIVRSQCKSDPAGYCGTKAEIYLWEKSKGAMADFATNIIMHRLTDENSNPFIILLGDADKKGIYTIEGNGNDAGGFSDVNLAFIPYKGKIINLPIPDSLFSFDEGKSRLYKPLIMEYIQKHIAKVGQFSPLAKEQLKLYSKAPDMECKEYIKIHKHPGWMLKVNLPHQVITWNIESVPVMCWCTFKWKKWVRPK